MKLDELCKSLCSGLAMRPVPIGYAIRTPFVGGDGDAIGMYLRRQPGAPNIVRFEDDGGTIASLESDGVNLSTDSRFEALASLLEQYGAQYDEAAELIHTDYFEEVRAGPNFVKFIALLLRIQDLRMLSTQKVERAFKDDVRAFVDEHFSGRVQIEEESNPSEMLADYVSDFVLRTHDGVRLALYASSTENKALEALLLWQELERQKIGDIRSMALLQTSKPSTIKQRTMSRLMNSGVLFGTMDGSRAELKRKIEHELRLH
jgi:hypothetical protein